MPIPFPGMDPYLERRGLWQEINTRLIVAIADAIAPQVAPRYRVGVEQRTYLALSPDEKGDFVGKPDVLITSRSRLKGASAGITVTTPLNIMPRLAILPIPDTVLERYLEIRDVETGDVVTVIELLSLANKRTRKGREEYEQKRLNILGSATNLIEIDLLRSGQAPYFKLYESDISSNYRIILSRAQQRPNAVVYLFGIRDMIPDIPIPLRPRETEPILSLNKLLHELYDRARYDLVIDYQKPPVPRLVREDAKWARDLLT